MASNKAFEKHVRTQIKAKCPGLACQGCDGTKWNVGDPVAVHAAEVLPAPGKKVPVFPLITLTCEKCGFTVFFNPAALGVVFD